MEIRFESRADVWRGRGRPPREPSARVIELLHQTAMTGTCATVTLADVTAEEVRDVKADLRAAQRRLGGRVHCQIVNNVLKFFWEPGQLQ